MRGFLFITLICFNVYAFGQEPRLVIPSGHTEAISAIGFSRDGKKILTGAEDKIAKIWDAETGHEILELKGHQGKINAAIFSPDGKTIATASTDSTIILWDAITGEIKKEFLGHKDQVSNVAFNKDGTKLVSVSWDNTIRIWDTSVAWPIKTITQQNAYFLSASFSHDGKKILSTSATKGPDVWDAITGKNDFQIKWNYPSGINYAFFSPDEKTIITVSYNHIAGQWNAATGDSIHAFNIPREQFFAVQLSEDGKNLYTASMNNKIKVWDVTSGEVKKEIQAAGNKTLTTLAVSGKEDQLAAGSLDRSAYLIRLSDDKLVQTFKSYTNPVGYARFSADGSKILVENNLQNHYKVLDAAQFRINTTISLKENELNSAKLLPNGKKILVASGSDSLFMADASNGKFLYSYSVNEKAFGPNPPAFSGNGEKFFMLGFDSIARVWNVNIDTLTREIADAGNPILTMDCSEDGSVLMTVQKDGTVRLYHTANGDTISVMADKVNESAFVQLSPDGKKVVAFTENNIRVWNAVDGIKMMETEGEESFRYEPAVFSQDGNWFLKETTYSKLYAYKIGEQKPKFIIDGQDDPFIRFQFSANAKEIITASKRLVKTWNVETGKFKEIPMGINFEFADINLNTNKILAFRNSEFKLMEYPSGEELVSFYLIEDKDWAVVHASGLFDGTPNAMALMYWVKGDEIIELNQLKDRFYEPGIWKKVMEKDALRDVAGMGEVKLYPQVITGELIDGILPLDIIKRNGGYGKISIYVNNIEVIEDARPAGFDTSLQKQRILVDISPYLVAELDNHISVKAQSSDGFITSRSVSTMKPALDSVKKRNPALYAIFCGTNEYSNPSIKLRYPVPDAEAMAKAVSLTGSNLFGADSTHLYVLTNPGPKPTTKENIRNTFEEIRKLAKPEDIVLVYLSGHGITLGGENDDFYYLTKDASGSRASSFRDPALRENQTISTAEFTQWLNGISAQKRIMIIDACGSGKAVDNLLAMRNIDAMQIRAIDRMKDRTGLYIISGCTADAESFESNIYGQGLLTYSILEGMKGPALKDYKMVDILNVIQYARERVPMLASGLGGIQQPQMLIPTTGGFDIGIVNETDKKQIPLAEVKPVFIRPVLLEATKKRDVLKLQQEVKQKMIEITAEKGPKSEFIFIDVDDFPGACIISGIYTIENDLISLNGTMQFDGRDIPIIMENISRQEFSILLIREALKKME